MFSRNDPYDVWSTCFWAIAVTVYATVSDGFNIDVISIVATWAREICDFLQLALNGVGCCADCCCRDVFDINGG